MLASPKSPFTQIRDVVAATLHPAATEYKLAVTVLVTGNAGVGKRTTVRWASRDLGLHVMEVDCFDVVDDTEVKTEGILKARFEQAEAVAPSVLLLRNIDALARKNQKMETGKGMQRHSYQF
jgi:peroxin-6